VTLTLTLREAPAAPVRVDGLTPARLAGLGRAEIERLELWHGNRRSAVGDLFGVSGDGEEDVRVEGDLARVAGIGAGMTGGRVTVDGRAGAHTGAGMTGGELEVTGDAGDWAGAEMRGGRLVVRGSAGRRLGGAYAGSRAGTTGGEIVVHGDTGDEAGAGIRRGLIAVGGRAGEATGLSGLAGTIVVLGAVGAKAGAGMRRASIVCMREPALLPSYAKAATYRPLFVCLMLRRLRELGLPVTDEHVEGRYTRWSGDALELNRGEILILETPA
jgi:formylmethanofuran dehydrogenase subunit C